MLVDLVLDDHVPVDPGGASQRGAAPPVLIPMLICSGVFFSSYRKYLRSASAGAEELRRPVALLARLPGGGRSSRWGGDGPGILHRHDGQDLATRDLRLDVPEAAVPYVAVHAEHTRVWGRQVRRVLRLQHGVAQGAAEGDGLAVEEGVVRNERHEHGEERPPSTT